MIKKPNFLIVGSAKCGTTALASILGSHPDCCMSQPKEVSFFQDTIDFEPNPNYEKGWEWYQTAFSHYSGEPIVGEATPSYSDRSRSPNTARRIFEFNPKMKIIYMVRDPLERQISAWRMLWTFGKEKSFPDRREIGWALEGFSSWLEKQQEVDQWEMCRYGYQLQAYRDFFPEEQICVTFLENWKSNKEKELEVIMQFLKIDPTRRDSTRKERANRGNERTIERPLFKGLRKLAMVRSASKMIPKDVKAEIVNRWSRTSLSPPEVNLESDIVSEFRDFVREDAMSFVEKYGNPKGAWKL